MSLTSFTQDYWLGLSISDMVNINFKYSKVNLKKKTILTQYFFGFYSPLFIILELLIQIGSIFIFALFNLFFSILVALTLMYCKIIIFTLSLLPYYQKNPKLLNRLIFSLLTVHIQSEKRDMLFNNSDFFFLKTIIASNIDLSQLIHLIFSSKGSIKISDYFEQLLLIIKSCIEDNDVKSLNITSKNKITNCYNQMIFIAKEICNMPSKIYKDFISSITFVSTAFLKSQTIYSELINILFISCFINSKQYSSLLRISISFSAFYRDNYYPIQFLFEHYYFSNQTAIVLITFAIWREDFTLSTDNKFKNFLSINLENNITIKNFLKQNLTTFEFASKLIYIPSIDYFFNNDILFCAPNANKTHSFINYDEDTCFLITLIIGAIKFIANVDYKQIKQVDDVKRFIDYINNRSQDDCVNDIFYAGKIFFECIFTSFQAIIYKGKLRCVNSG